MAVMAMRRRGGYSDLECSEVSQMILDTTLLMTGEPSKATPHSLRIFDADLSNLGRIAFGPNKALTMGSTCRHKIF